jgi:hypothetical protein
MTFKRHLLATAAMLFLVPATSHAISFTATLTSMKIQARPGQVLTRQFQVTLDKDQPRTQFRTRVEDWWRSEDGTESFYADPGTLQHSCGSWVSLNPVEAAIDPGQTLNVRVTVSVPGELAPGGYWCVLTLEEVPNPLAAPTGVGVQFLASTSTGIFVYVDPVTRAATITDVDIVGEEAAIRVQNDGNAPLGVEGRVQFLREGQANPIAEVMVPRATLLRDPAPSARFKTALPSADVLPSGRYLVRVILDIGLDHYIGVQREMDIIRSHLTAEAR